VSLSYETGEIVKNDSIQIHRFIAPGLIRVLRGIRYLLNRLNGFFWGWVQALCEESAVEQVYFIQNSLFKYDRHYELQIIIDYLKVFIHLLLSHLPPIYKID